MTKQLRKIEAMYHYYGRDPKCRACIECDFCIRGDYHDRRYYKCKVYGLSRSEATDWRISYCACGLIGKPFPVGDKRIVDVLKHDKVKKVEQVEGQTVMNLEGEQ